MSEHKPYPSDLSDEQRSLIEPVITAWKDLHRSVSGHQGAYAMREIVNAILYQGRTGCQWTYLPHDLPPKSATYYYFAAWRDDGTDQVTENTGGTVEKALVDRGFKNQVVLHGALLGTDVEIIERNPRDKGFVPQPKRWKVEQTYGILILHRRLVRDYEHRPASSASRVYWAMSHVMARRLTHANTPTWRDPQAVTA